jgi:hypothetical protein
VIKTEREAAASGYQFNFTVRRRVAREDGDEHLFDFYTVVVGIDGAVDDELAQIAAGSYSEERGLDPAASSGLERLDVVGVDRAFEVAKAHLEGQTKLWDWDEEVDVIGVAKVLLLPK